MLESVEQLLNIARRVYGDEMPKDFRVLDAAARVARGVSPTELSKQTGTTKRRLEALSVSHDAVFDVFKTRFEDSPPDLVAKARAILGQLLLGVLAERAFEVIYRAELGTDDLQLEDQREGYTETDYRVLNGGGRPVFRLNIKFHGTLFQRARDMVGLDPEDCFALATYKINQAVIREREEVLPYVFAIVSVPGLTAEAAASVIPDDLLALAAFVHGSKMPRKRAVEDAIIRYVAGPEVEPVVRERVATFVERIRTAKWRLISATKADRMLRELLFDRVYAVRVRAFNRNYRNAEVDMHFSLDNDLMPLPEFLQLVKDRGLHGATSYLTAGRA